MHAMDAAAKSGEPFDFKSWIEGRSGMPLTKQILGTGEHEALIDVINALSNDLCG